jgi:hypothetical protein
MVRSEPSLEVDPSEDTNEHVVAANIDLESADLFRLRIEHEAEGHVRGFGIKRAKAETGEQISRLISEPEILYGDKAEVGAGRAFKDGPPRATKVRHQKPGLSIAAGLAASGHEETLVARILGVSLQEANIDSGGGKQQSVGGKHGRDTEWNRNACFGPRREQAEAG